MDYPLFALAAIAGTSFILALSGALMPAPLLTVTVAEAAQRGVRAGPLIITGHAILELLLVVAVIKGLGGVSQRSPGHWHDPPPGRNHIAGHGCGHGTQGFYPVLEAGGGFRL